MSQAATFSILLMLTAAAYIALAVRAVTGREESGSRTMGLIFLLVGVWVAGGAIELIAPNRTLFHSMSSLPGLAFFPVPKDIPILILGENC